VPRFALDQNFPTPIVAVLRDYLVEADLVSIRDVHPKMPTLPDWELLLALYHDAGDWDGLVTTDASMVKLPRELSVLLQTKLTLVVAEAAGHDPLKATGLLLTHLPGICKRSRKGVPQLWVLSARTRGHDDPWTHLESLAKRQKVGTKVLYERNRLTDEELRRNPAV
jgi:hypothetical protein